MTNKNTRSKGEYALDHILWGLISWLWFTKSLFRNIEGLSYDRSRLDEDTWVQLSSREKLDVLQTVANIEARYFGLPHALNVISGNLEHNILACYNDQMHLITIDLHHLEYDSARSVLKSLCHEARHAYQHRLCDVYDGAAETQKTLLLFRSVQCFQQEFSNYVEGSDDPTGYYTQQCETDARAYADEATADYYARIHAYLKENRA